MDLPYISGYLGFREAEFFKEEFETMRRKCPKIVPQVRIEVTSRVKNKIANCLSGPKGISVVMNINPKWPKHIMMLEI